LHHGLDDLWLFRHVVPWLSRFGLGRLPGDINFRVFGRRISIPLASTLLIFLLFFLIGKFL
jgi:hypothetical protein